ncbi:Ketimine reductase mu-crystallin [Cladophialophora carrionii]|uniref:Ketimine reductase mu-crystallin n=1 Tax=Cladophialophora carrionii TaxID=86049 RepID=A0A1C1CFF2_9EURO|nr:Ketimine reductase mu-crystallin [Cladophialophora carrionii]
MIILKERDVHSLLSDLSATECHRLLTSLHDVLRAYSSAKDAALSEQTLHQPERGSIVTRLGNTSLFMPSSVTTSTGIKIVTISPGGLKGCINVFAPEGDLLGLLNAEEVTAFRTALAVMIPYVRWPRSKKNIVVFGAGRQAEWHVKLALLLSDVESITVVNRGTGRRMEQLFADLGHRYPGVMFELLLRTSDDFDSRLRPLLAASDVIFCCTPATTPHFPSSYLGTKARFISLIGSYKPSMQEVDSATLLSGDCIYVDTREGCLAEAGELINANVRGEQLVEIGQLRGVDPFTTNRSLIFKCVGMGIMDLVMASELLTMAQEKGLGVVINDF